jgi:xanthine dehydrogenase accessory factor
MRTWVGPLVETLQRGGTAALVHVAELRGSGPREVGTQMLVTDTDLFGTIGGGQLEHSAMLTARQMMGEGRGGIVRWALGPELGQCCGGSVTLGFEPFSAADLGWVTELMQAGEGHLPVFRTVRVDTTGAFRRDWRAEGSRAETAFVATLAAGRLVIRERINEPLPPLWLFGAGHVGRALARAVHPLGFALTWIDGRTGQFPASVPPDVKTLELALPETAVEEAPPGTTFLVMTYSHPLDEAVCEAVLRRGDFEYLGLIGSDTKRARFVHRLIENGVAPDAIARLTCPIGLAGIKSKDPAAIAASVAADLLIRREKKDQKLGGRNSHAA